MSNVWAYCFIDGYSQTDLVHEGEGAITLSPTNMNSMFVDYSKCTYLSWKKYFESPEIMVNPGGCILVKVRRHCR